jgi:8-oxo-dGTP diphosphatase
MTSDPVRTCLALLTRPAPAGPGAAGSLGADGSLEVLVGFKKTGFGAGRWVGLGGHIEAGEEPWGVRRLRPHQAHAAADIP